VQIDLGFTITEYMHMRRQVIVDVDNDTQAICTHRPKRFYHFPTPDTPVGNARQRKL
jgi:hypothetical protein